MKKKKEKEKTEKKERKFADEELKELEDALDETQYLEKPSKASGSKDKAALSGLRSDPVCADLVRSNPVRSQVPS